jgi:hypothetical protein
LKINIVNLVLPPIHITCRCDKITDTSSLENRQRFLGGPRPNNLTQNRQSLGRSLPSSSSHAAPPPPPPPPSAHSSTFTTSGTYPATAWTATVTGSSSAPPSTAEANGGWRDDTPARLVRLKLQRHAAPDFRSHGRWPAVLRRVPLVPGRRRPDLLRPDATVTSTPRPDAADPDTESDGLPSGTQTRLDGNLRRSLR